ncbi:hypothetical protein B9W73_03605 [Lactococcus lactis]|uniref:DUF1642 domain-containing protein n=1 Tax=Lactococcus lactis TaxID=1358 RepID=UPI000A1FE0FC|nr:DUF1642 domain-containing protein [Lactococcus lactis]OSP87370.1 hypothetical protein B9W73_03605 [Lactococcus lactis]
MTKFEEDLNRKMDLKEVPMYFTQSGCSLTKKTYIETNWVFDTYKNWRSDEEFQELKKHCEKLENENSFMRDERTTFDSNGTAVEPIIQQQSLPVVPECVGKTVEILKKKPESSWSKLYEALGEEGVTWLNEFQHNDERFGFGGLNSKLIVLFHLAINGYQVEKPQLFYLKNKLTGLYLYRLDKVDFREQDYCKDRDDKPLDYCLFTQAEIDSMETGSYEQIEVVK